jgi:hypothetical protein
VLTLPLLPASRLMPVCRRSLSRRLRRAAVLLIQHHNMSTVFFRDGFAPDGVETLPSAGARGPVRRAYLVSAFELYCTAVCDEVVFCSPANTIVWRWVEF